MSAPTGSLRPAHRTCALFPVALGVGLVMALAGVASASAQVAAVEPASRVVEVEVPAPALEGNLLGTPSVQGAAIYLPPSYEFETERRYPVIYLLHGIFDRYQVWLETFSVPAILDRLIAANEIPELIVVMPNGFNHLGGGFYRNSPASGNWADFVSDDLVGFVDGSFRTLARTESRAIAGHSMGGYGALHLGMTRPDVFSVVWALSPCCLAAVDDFGFGNDAWKRARRFQSLEDMQGALESGEFYPVVAIGVLTAFSPDPDSPPFFVDFPYEIVRGEIVLDDADYDRYLDALPVRAVTGAREALRGLRGLGLGVGLGDQFLHISSGTLELSRRLGEERIPHRLDLYAGDHRQLVSRRLEEVVFLWIAERLVAGDD